MTITTNKDVFKSAANFRATLPARESRFVMFSPKGGRTLSLPNGEKDDAIWEKMGFSKGPAITDTLFELRDTRGEISDTGTKIWLNERKPKDIMRLLSTPDDAGYPQGNLGIVGDDVRDEFSGFMQTREAYAQGCRVNTDALMQLDVSRGGIAVLMPDWLEIKSFAELAGCDIVTKYPRLADQFRQHVEKQYGIIMGQTRPRDGGTEDDILLDNKMNVIIDFVQSGKSAANRHLRVPFMAASAWQSIKDGKTRFDDIEPRVMAKMPAVLQTSMGILVRPKTQFPTEQERIGTIIQERLKRALVEMGRKPVTPKVRTDNYPAPIPRVRDIVQQEVGHGWRYRA